MDDRGEAGGKGIASWRKGDPFGMVAPALLIPVLDDMQS